jgi:hypothetical protein
MITSNAKREDLQKENSYGLSEERKQPHPTSAVPSASGSKRDPHPIPPIFPIPELNDSHNTLECLCHDLFTKIFENLSLETSNHLDFYPLPQEVLDDMEKHFTPTPLPIDIITDSLSEFSLLDLASSPPHESPSEKEEHIAFCPGPIDEFIGDEKQVLHISQFSAVPPLNKRPLLFSQNAASFSTDITKDNTGLVTKPLSEFVRAKSLNDMLDYHKSLRLKKLKTDSGSSSSLVDTIECQGTDVENCYGKLVGSQSQSPLPPSEHAYYDDIEFDSEMLNQIDESIAIVKNSTIPLYTAFVMHVFISSTVEKAIHQYIISTIRPRAPAPR